MEILMVKDLCDLMEAFQSGSSPETEERLPGFHALSISPSEISVDDLPRIDCEIDILQPKLGEDRLEEYIIRKRLFMLARGTDKKNRKKAREILEQVYHLKLIP